MDKTPTTIRHALLWSLLSQTFYEHRFVVAWNIYSIYTPQKPTNWKIPTAIGLSKLILNSGPLAFVQVNDDGTFSVIRFNKWNGRLPCRSLRLNR